MTRPTAAFGATFAFMLFAGRTAAQDVPPPDPLLDGVDAGVDAGSMTGSVAPDTDPQDSQPPSPSTPEPERATTDAQAPSQSVPLPARSEQPVFSPWIELFAEYGFTWTDVGSETEWSHAFELPRAHVGLGASWHGVRARALVETVRSSGRGAILGVAGDSLVVRMREAWIGYLFGGFLDFGAGLVPTMTIPALDGLWAHRVVAASALETTGLASPADLGARVTLRLPRSFGTLGAAGYAGEGYTSRDLNRGKSTELFAAIRPLAFVPSLRPLTAVVSYVIGSTGTSAARANRLTAGLAWDAPRVAGGVAFHYAWGVDGDGSRNGWVLEGFARAEPVERLLLAVRASRFVRDADVSGDTYDELHGAVGFRVATPLELFLAVDRTVPGERAATALPGADAWTLRLAARAAIGL